MGRARTQSFIESVSASKGICVADSAGAEVDCFTLGVQFPFQKQKMLELADGNVITMDATFGTTGLGVSIIFEHAASGSLLRFNCCVKQLVEA